MCLVLIAVDRHPEYPIVVAMNRDEFYERPTKEAHYWLDQPHILAGRDLEKGGTWLGLHRAGKFALVTNFRDSGPISNASKSRGLLVRDFLSADLSPLDYLHRVRQSHSDYNGFNLIVGESLSVVYYSSQTDRIVRLGPGLYGLSNHLLDTPWPKVKRGKERFQHWLGAGSLEPDPLLQVMKDPETFSDESLPKTGVGIEMERLLAPIFVQSPRYGTRSTTFFALGSKGNLHFVERSYNAAGEIADRQEYRFNPREDEA